MISDRLRANLAGEFRESLLAKLGLIIVIVILFMAIFGTGISW